MSGADCLAAAGTAYELTVAEYKAVEAIVGAALKDPESARYSGFAAVEDTGMVIVCGFVNARNSFGGYAGKSPFMASYAPATGQGSVITMGEPQHLAAAVIAACQTFLGRDRFP